MKKSLFILLALFAFACGNSENTNTENTNETATEEDVEMGSGEEINPQLEFEGDTQDAFEVDTINSATDANNQGTDSDTSNQGQ